MSIAVVVGTYNRAPGANYLAGLLASLKRSGLWACGLLDQGTLHLVDGGSASFEHLDALQEVGGPLEVHYGVEGMHANDNFLHMVQVGIETQAPWVISLEDDVTPCQDFLVKVDTWRQANATDGYHLFPLYCPYQDIVWAHEKGQPVYRYAVSSFYGTQGLLWRREDLESYVAWYAATGEQPCWWDILLQRWHQALWRGQKYFLAPVPSLLQHVGVFSALGLHDRFHTAPCVEALA